AHPRAKPTFSATDRCFRASVAARSQRLPPSPGRSGPANVTHCVNTLPSTPGVAMTVFTRILLAPALAVLVVVGEASPQAYRTAVGYGGGGVFVTPLNAGASGGAEELRLEAGWIMGAELEHRVGSGWLGLRLHGAYTQRPFALEGRTLGKIGRASCRERVWGREG